MEITAQLVKQLRDKTGAGMMDCKRALIENNGNLESAEEYLRKKGLMDAAKKSSRTAADGLVAVIITEDKKSAAIVEVNSETDFVARNDKFQELVREITKTALKNENVINEKLSSGNTVKEEIDHLISLIGENMTFRRAKKLEVKNGLIASYVHNATASEMGKIGVLVVLEAESEFSPEKLEELGRKLAMHVAAANPTYLCPKCVPQDIIAKEKEIAIAKAKELGKPDNIAEKMAEGQVKKYLEETTLLEQVYVMDGKTKVKDVIDSFNSKNGFNVKISEFVKFILGEGIEKTETNFAEEVASFIK